MWLLLLCKESEEPSGFDVLSLGMATLWCECKILS